MYDKQSILDECRKFYTTWSEQELNDYAEFMAKKYSTIKHGENVVHLEYYGGLIDETDIETIEATLSTSNLQLSRFDKDGVPYASIEDFILQVALFVGDKTTQDILFGVGINALWDSIKKTTFYIWQTIRSRTSLSEPDKKNKLNFGINMSIDKNTSFEFKIDGKLSDEVVLKSIDKVLDFLRTAKPNQRIKKSAFVIYDKEKEIWEILDVNAEMMKMILESRKNNSTDKATE